MWHRITRKSISVFMVVVLVLTCNSATAQPFAAFAAEETVDTVVELETPLADVDGSLEEAPALNADLKDGVSVPDAELELGLNPTPDAESSDVEDDGEGNLEASAGKDGQVTDGAANQSGTAVEQDEARKSLASADAVVQGDAQDVTYDTEQLSLRIGSFSWRDAANAYTAIEPNGTGDYQLPSPFEAIKGLKLVLDFTVLKDDETRIIKEGDMFTFALNQKNTQNVPYFSLSDTTVPQEIRFGGNLVATYEVKDGVLKATFSKNVNFSEGFSKIKGGINLSFDLNGAAFSGEDETGIDLVLQDIGHPTHVTVPPKSSVVDGVEKQGEYNPATRSITWTIKAGTESVGLDMSGMILVDTYDTDSLAFVSASAMGADGAMVDLTSTVQQSEGLCSYTFPSGSLAPQTVQIVTKVKDTALPTHDASTISNGVALEQGVSPYKPGSHKAAQAEVKVPGMGLQKEGKQIDGNKMQWSIVVNEAEDAWLWDAIITDVLAANLEYCNNTLKIDGDVISVTETPPSPATSDYATLVKNADGTHTLAIHFVDADKEIHGDKPIISRKHTITFETSLLDSSIEDAKIENTASLSGRWPNGDGPGVAYNQTMGIGTEYRYAFVKKDGEVDQHTGLITWKVNPQTRLDGFETALLVDVVDASDQKFVNGSLELEYNGTTTTQQDLVDGGWLTVMGAGSTENPTTLTFTLPKDYFPELAQVHITYKTQATVGFLDGAYGKPHIYSNTVDLTVQTVSGMFQNTATAEVPLANYLIGKTANYEYDDFTGEGRLHYTLVVNENKMELRNVVVTDDLSRISSTYYKNDGTSVGLLASDWKYDSAIVKNSAGAIQSFATTNLFSVDMGTIIDTYTIDLYLTLTDEAKQKYLLDSGSGYIRTINEATISGTCSGGDIRREAGFETTPEQGDIANELVDKSSQLNEATGAIRWRVDVNPQGAMLQNAVVKDVLNKSLQLDTLTIKLYESKHRADGLISQADPDSDPRGKWTEVSGTPFVVEPGDDGSSVLRVNLPNGNKAYTLVYETAITEAVDTGFVQNRASLINDGAEKADGSHTQELDNNSWGYLERTASYRFVKLDSLGGSAQPLGLGVKFGLFADEGCTNQIKSVTANEHGAFGFYGLAPGTTYWYKELGAPDGYVLDQTAYKLEVPTDVKGIQPNVITVTNERTKLTGNIEIVKEFEGAATDAMSFEREAHFQLTLRPLGGGNAKTVGVALTGADGTYTYEKPSASVDAATDLVVKASSGSATATLSLSDLPWGDYELRETSAPDGYVLPRTETKFTVDKQGSVTFAADGGSRLQNMKTHVTLKKLLNGVQEKVTGASFSIYQRTASTVEANPVISQFTNAAYTWASDGNPWEIVGLPAGSYTLREVTPATDTTIAEVADVPFTIASDGTLKLDASVAHVDVVGATITVDNVSCAAAKVSKLDQFGHTVSGATVRLDKKVGSTWETVGTPVVTNGSILTFAGLDRNTDYRVVETVTPQGYLQTQPIEFSLDIYGTVQHVELNKALDTPSSYGNTWDGATFTLRDERIMGHVQFKKVVEGSVDTPLAGATFDLYRVDLGSVDTKVNGSAPFVSNAQGVVTTVGSALTEGLEPGTYYFVETAAPAGYQFDPAAAAQSDRFTVEADGTNRYTEVGGFMPRNVIDLASITNRALAASVLVHKATEAGGALSGAEFTLAGRDADGTEVSLIALTDTAGTARFDHVSSGSFVIKETRPPAGYQLGGQEFAVTVDQGVVGKVYDLNSAAPLVNVPTRIAVEKVDGSDNSLAGAEFVLEGTFADGSNMPRVWTSGINPELIVGELVVSNVYKLTERTAPEHYVASAVSRELMLDTAGTLCERAAGSSDAWVSVAENVLKVSNRPVRGQVEVIKSVIGGDGTVAGIEFDLFKQGTESGDDLVIAHGATDAVGVWRTLDQGALNPDTGDALSEGLAAGSYCIVETKAAPDTELNRSPHTFVIADSNHFATTTIAVQVPLENRAFAASIELAKVDGVTGDSVVGAAFALTYVPEGGGAEQTLAVPAVGDQGHFHLDGLKKGSYTLQETVVPNGYTQPFKATFKLSDSDNGKTVEAREGLAAPHVVVSKEEGAWSHAGISNTRLPGSVTLKKVEAGTSDGLAGAEFTLTGPDGYKKIHKTTSDGVLDVQGLVWGDYFIKETKAADGYRPGAEAPSFAFKIGPNNGTDVHLVWDHGTIENAKTGITIDKIDDTNSPQRLDGAILKLTGAFADGASEKVWVSKKDMAEAFEGQLIVGEHYTLVEERRLPHYLELPGSVTFSLTTAGRIELITNSTYADGSMAAVLSPDGMMLSVRNVRMPGVVTLLKTDARTTVPLSDVSFALYDEAGKLIRDDLTTGCSYRVADWSKTADTDGRLTVTGLDLGSYYFQEKAAEGYQVLDTKYWFMIDDVNGVSTPSVDLGTIKNAPMEFSFVKTALWAESCSDVRLGAEGAASTQPLAGAEFTAYTNKECTVVGQTIAGVPMVATSADDGRVVFSSFKAGTYYVKETVVPRGYVSKHTIYQLEVAPDGKVAQFSPTEGEGGVQTQVINDVPRADIRIKKVSETDESKVLPNSTYGLYKRVKPQASLPTRSVMLLSAQAPVEEDLQLIAQATTGADGYLVFEGVLIGQAYVIKELAAPDGSLVSENPITIEFARNDAGEVRIVSFDDGSGTAEVDEDGVIIWKEPQVIVSFDKKDPEGDLLAGATLQVVDEHGAVVGNSWVSTAEDGHRIEGELVAGAAYHLVELDAPKGYVVAGEVPFIVENPKVGPQENFVQHIEMVNVREASLSPVQSRPPNASQGLAVLLAKTGDIPLGLLVGGAGLIAAGVVAAVGTHRRRRRY